MSPFHDTGFPACEMEMLLLTSLVRSSLKDTGKETVTFTQYEENSSSFAPGLASLALQLTAGV